MGSGNPMGRPHKWARDADDEYIRDIDGYKVPIGAVGVLKRSLSKEEEEVIATENKGGSDAESDLTALTEDEDGVAREEESLKGSEENDEEMVQPRRITRSRMTRSSTTAAKVSQAVMTGDR
jgi:hypothetical protein